MAKQPFHPGDQVIVCRTRHKSHPGRRARDVRPAAHGDDYCYYVEKLWTVVDVLADGRLLLTTPRGKQHVVGANDPNLRRVNWFDRIRNRALFAPSSPQ